MAAPVDNESADYYDQDDPVADIEQDFLASSSAPSSDERLKDVRPKWVNPCGALMEHTEGELSPPLSDSQVAENALIDIKIALDHVHLFQEQYVRSVFRMDYAHVIRAWSHIHYDWLPNDDVIPKQVGDQVAHEHLQSLQFGETLKKLYSSAQMLAVAMEQVILDRAVYGGDFLEEFATTENKLASVLCALQIALLEKNVEADADATRQIMSRKYRDMRNTSSRNLRDFIILRDYTNMLEYVLQVLLHFKNSPE